MNTETSTTEIINPTLVANKKGFIGILLSIAGIVFMLAGIAFFIALICALKFQLDIFTALMIGSLVVGIPSFAVGSAFVAKK
jgi:hypothetical protein